MTEFIKIPGYRIEGLLGEGGMAKVYLAIQESLERQVALKVMNTSLASDPSFCERFLKEGRIVAQLSSHPDIVTIFDIGYSGSNYYMAMEYISGANLKQLIQSKVPIERPLLVIKQIASALGFAHRRGFIHRDVKPANILFKEDGTATLTDFGIAKALSSNTQLTKVGYTVGTAEYMSPEQAIGRGIDSRSDIYSLGVVLYELLSGEKPFVGEDPFSTALMHATAPVPKLPEAYAAYSVLIDRMLAKDPNDRFETAEHLIQRIDELTGLSVARISKTQTLQASRSQSIAQNGSRTVSNGSVSALHSVANAFSRWKWWLASGSITVVIGTILVFGGVYFKNFIEIPSFNQSWSPPLSVSPKPDPQPNDPKLKKKISLLLEVAQAHFDVGRLTSPPGSNAYEAYEMVLEIDPGNRQAIDGIKRIEREAEQ